MSRQQPRAVEHRPSLQKGQSKLNLSGCQPLVQPGFCNGTGFENDFTFDHTFYIGADPEIFGGGGVILNKVEC